MLASRYKATSDWYTKISSCILHSTSNRWLAHNLDAGEEEQAEKKSIRTTAPQFPLRWQHRWIILYFLIWHKVPYYYNQQPHTISSQQQMIGISLLIYHQWQKAKFSSSSTTGVSTSTNTSSSTTTIGSGVIVLAGGTRRSYDEDHLNILKNKRRIDDEDNCLALLVVTSLRISSILVSDFVNSSASLLRTVHTTTHALHITTGCWLNSFKTGRQTRITSDEGQIQYSILRWIIGRLFCSNSFAGEEVQISFSQLAHSHAHEI